MKNDLSTGLSRYYFRLMSEMIHYGEQIQPERECVDRAPDLAPCAKISRTLPGSPTGSRPVSRRPDTNAGGHIAPLVANKRVISVYRPEPNKLISDKSALFKSDTG